MGLGCTLFEIHIGKKLFGMFEYEVDEHLFIIASVLGKLPRAMVVRDLGGKTGKLQRRG